MTFVLGASRLPLGMLAMLQSQSSTQSPLLSDVVDVAGLAEMLPLSRARYVDVGTTVPAAERNGTIARPFATIQAAVDVLTSGGLVLIAPGTYTEPSVAVPAGRVIAFVGLSISPTFTGPNVRINNSLQGGFNDIAAIGVDVANAVSSVARATVINSTVVNLSGGTGFRAVDSSITNASASSGTSTARACSFTGNTNIGGALEAVSCEFPSGTVNVNVFTARFCTFGVAIASITSQNLWKCRLAAAGLSTLALTSDYDSIAQVLPNVTVTGAFTLNGPQACKTLVAVAVPPVADGNVEYVDVTFAGTDLDGLVPAGSLLIANPTDDLELSGPGGAYCNIRCTAANTARLAFLGPLPGGAVNFLIGVV